MTASASSQPPPAAAPFTAAMTGHAQSQSPHKHLARAVPRERARLVESVEFRDVRACAEGPCPVSVRMTARKSARLFNSRKIP